MGTEQHADFNKIKRQLQKTLVLYMPNNRGRFHPYSDTGNFAIGRTFYQIQNGQPRLTAYSSKRIKTSAQSYPIMELESCVFDINIAGFPHL